MPRGRNEANLYGNVCVVGTVPITLYFLVDRYHSELRGYIVLRKPTIYRKKRMYTFLTTPNY